jgi:hypothetical protein
VFNVLLILSVLVVVICFKLGSNKWFRIW